MKLIQNIDKEIPSRSVFRIELQEGENCLSDWIFRNCEEKVGELYIPEGIEMIKREAFKWNEFHTVHLPKSIKQLERDIFSLYSCGDTKMIYPGTSLEFMQVGAVEKEEICESDGYDRYPYYSGNSEWVTYYRCFDRSPKSIEVVCEGDGVTLLYGIKNRADAESPKVKPENA